MGREIVVRYEDFQKSLVEALNLGSAPRTEEDIKEWVEKFSKKIPLFKTRKKSKCINCDKFNSKLGYCKLLNVNVGLFNSCKESIDV